MSELPPIAWLFLDLAIRSTLIVLLVDVATRGLAKLGLGASGRHAVWLATIAAIAALPLLILIAPDFIVAVPHAIAGFVSPDLSTPGDRVPGLAHYAPLVWIAYATGAMFFVLRLVAARMTLEKLWRAARPFEADTELTRRFNLDIELRLVDAPIAPMTWRRRILLPAEAAQWPDVRRRDVMQHELAHMVRRDSLTQILAGYVRALMWFSPGVWLALRQLRIEQEQAADAFVLAAGAAPHAYAQTLVDVATGLRAPTLGMGVSATMAPASDLERRVEAIVAERPPALRTQAAAALGALTLALAGFLVSVRPVDAALILPPLAPMTGSLGILQPTLPPLPQPAWSPGG